MFDKFKGSKKLQIGIVVVLVIALFVIFGSTVIPLNFGSKSADNSNSKTVATTCYEYAKYLEAKLSSTLAEIKNAGKVSVMIMLDGDIKIEIAYTTEERTTSSSGSSSNQESSTTTQTPVLITQNGVTGPIILNQIYPDIKGVIIVASGASDAAVKINILRATVAVLDIDAGIVEIFAGKE